MTPPPTPTSSRKVARGGRRGATVRAASTRRRGPASASAASTDLYRHVNGRWLARTRIPSFEASYSVSEEMEATIAEELLRSLAQLRRAHPRAPLALLSASALHSEGVRDLQTVRALWQEVAAAAGQALHRHTVEPLCALMGRLAKAQLPTLLALSVAPDTNRSATSLVDVDQPEGGLGLPLPEEYGLAHPLRKRYAALLREVGEAVGAPDLPRALRVEGALVHALLPPGASEDTGHTYHPFTLAQLQAHPTLGALHWPALLRGWGAPAACSTEARAKLVLRNPPYVALVGRVLVAATGSAAAAADLAAALFALAVRPLLPHLPPLAGAHFALYGRALQGQVAPTPTPLRMLHTLQAHAPQALSALYVAEHVPPTLKREAEALVLRLRAAALRRLAGATWLSQATRAAAAAKVVAMRMRIAHPTVFPNEASRLPLTGSLVDNLLTLSRADSAVSMQDLPAHCGGDLGPPYPPPFQARGSRAPQQGDPWSDGAFEANAFYYPEGNEMVVPAGLLRPPLFDPTKPLAWNLGGAGAAIGHEMTHAFDEEGRNFNAAGDYKPWWTPADNAAFKAKTVRLQRLYEGRTHEGAHVNGLLTLSENLADLGGVAIALEALREAMQGASAAQHRKAWRTFFTSYATSWRTKDRRRFAAQASRLDTHAPAPLRVNLVVRNFEEYHQAFGVGVGHPHFVPPEERVQLW